MKVVLLISLCLFFSFSVSAQPETEVEIPEVSIEEVSLARDDGNGKAGEATVKFLTSDTPIYCFIQLSSTRPATVKLILVAVKADGLKPETKSVSVSYTTNGKQNQVNFNASPEGAWAAGSYRADIFLNGKLVKSQSFEIEKPLKETQPQKSVITKPSTPYKNTKKAPKKLIRAAN